MVGLANARTGYPVSTSKDCPEQHASRMQASTKRDSQLVRRTQQGDLAAFNELILAYQDAVYRQAYWLLGEEEAAEDAAQEAFFRAFRKISTYDGQSFRAWIIRITTNYCFDQLRRMKCRPTVRFEGFEQGADEETECTRWLIDSSASPEQVVEQAELSAFINQCLLRLTPEQRVPMILVDIQEMDYQEAAAVLKLPLGTFKSRLSRARTKFMELMKRGPQHTNTPLGLCA